MSEGCDGQDGQAAGQEARETPDRGFAGGKPRADRLTAEQAFAELRRRQLQRPR